MTSASAQKAAHMILGQIYTNEVTDTAILTALAEVPREPFLPAHLQGAAYVDQELEVAPNRYLMEPLSFAKLVALADLQPSSRVLVIGALGGYAPAVIAKLAGHVVATETDASMIPGAREIIRHLSLNNVDVQQVASLSDGYAASAPYDVIFIAGAVIYIPESLGNQLASGGRIVTVRSVGKTGPGIDGLGKGIRITRIDHKLQVREYFDTGAHILPGFEDNRGFIF